MNGLWKDNHAFLVFEAEDNLTDVLTVLLGEIVQQWFSKQVLVTFTQWGPSFQCCVGLG